MKYNKIRFVQQGFPSPLERSIKHGIRYGKVKTERFSVIPIILHFYIPEKLREYMLVELALPENYDISSISVDIDDYEGYIQFKFDKKCLSITNECISSMIKNYMMNGGGIVIYVCDENECGELNLKEFVFPKGNNLSHTIKKINEGVIYKLLKSWETKCGST